jgi:hypothetical protein
MKSIAIKLFLVASIFASFYSLWGSLGEPQMTSLAAMSLPVMLGPRLFLLLIPIEGLLFSFSCLILLWPRIRGERALFLSVVGVLANCITYCMAFLSVWWGFFALEAVVILSAVGFFLLIRALASARHAKKFYIFVVAAVVAPSTLVPGMLLFPAFSLLVSKGLWWVAVLGVAAVSMRGDKANNSFKADGFAAA